MSESNQTNDLPHCKHFVIRKKRYCKMTLKSGEEYCGEHQKIGEENNDITQEDSVKNSRLRIVCPLDRKHTCYAHNLRKHLKICNAGHVSTEPYISKGINSGKESDVIMQEYEYKLLSTFPVPAIKDTILKVNELYDRSIKNQISKKVLSHKLVEEELSKPEYGDKTKKHLKQASAILGLLNEYRLMKGKTCYIEFGAGRGQLSYWIAQATESDEGTTILLVERASPKHKRDNKLDKSAHRVQRIRADISDLVLDKLDVITETENIVGVTKHLCGEATDLASRCLANIKENSKKFSGAVFTFCCHHRCRWVSYTGREFYEKNNLSVDDFYIMCGMASWATCGTGLSRERRNNGADTAEMINKQNERDIEIGLTREEKEELGKKSKHILNWGRLVYLENLGFNCVLHYYVDPSISLENVCMVVYR